MNLPIKDFSAILYGREWKNFCEEVLFMKKRLVFAALSCFLLGSVMLSACSSPVGQTVIPDVIQVQQVEKNENRISL